MPEALMMESSSGFNSEIFRSVFEISSATKILGHQLSVGGVVNKALWVAADMLDMPQMKQFSIRYVSPIQELIDQKMEALKQKEIHETELNNIARVE